MPTLRVSPWDYSSIVKNGHDMTEGEFVEWVLSKWPNLRDHLYEKIEVEVDIGVPPVVWQTIQLPTYVLVLRFVTR